MSDQQPNDLAQYYFEMIQSTVRHYGWDEMEESSTSDVLIITQASNPACNF
jgi:hypothetical protein